MERMYYWTLLPRHLRFDGPATAMSIAWAQGLASHHQRRVLIMCASVAAAASLTLIAIGLAVLVSQISAPGDFLFVAGGALGTIGLVISMKVLVKAIKLSVEVPEDLAVAYWTIAVVPFRSDAVFLWNTLHEDRGQITIFAPDRQGIEQCAQLLNGNSASLDDEADFLEKLGELRRAIAQIHMLPQTTSIVHPQSPLGQALAAIWDRALPLNRGKAAGLITLPNRCTGERTQWTLCCDGIRCFLQACHGEMLKSVKDHTEQQVKLALEQLSGMEAVQRHGVVHQLAQSAEPSPALVTQLRETVTALFQPVLDALKVEIQPELERLHRLGKTEADRTRSDYEDRLRRAESDHNEEVLRLQHLRDQFASDYNDAVAQLEAAKREEQRAQRDQTDATGMFAALFSIPTSDKVRAAQQKLRSAEAGLTKTWRQLQEAERKYQDRRETLSRQQDAELEQQTTYYAQRREELERHLRLLTEEREELNSFLEGLLPLPEKSTVGSWSSGPWRESRELLVTPKVAAAAIARYRASALREIRDDIVSAIDLLQEKISQCETATRHAAWHPSAIPLGATIFMIPVCFIRWRKGDHCFWRPLFSVSDLSLHERRPIKGLHFAIDDRLSRPVVDWIAAELDQAYLEKSLTGRSLLADKSSRGQLQRSVNVMLAEGLVSKKLVCKIESSLRSS